MEEKGYKIPPAVFREGYRQAWRDLVMRQILKYEGKKLALKTKPGDWWLRIIFEAACEADFAGLLGKCEDHMDEDGTCRLCTALEQAQSLCEEGEDGSERGKKHFINLSGRGDRPAL
jgi:hypothetical protein